MAAALLAASLAACGGGAAPVLRQAPVNGAQLTYADSGAPAAHTLLFLHGAVTDLRMWDAHRAIAAGRSFRTVAYSQRYHGDAEWGAGWPPYGTRTHAADLIAFVAQLQGGPVDLVAWSYAGHVALLAALERPDLFRSVFIHEPGVPSYVTDPEQMAAFGADAGAAFGPIFEAAGRGDTALALKRLLDASGQAEGYFEAQPAIARTVQQENARTLPELLFRQETAPAISCEQLRGLRVPVRVAYGARSRPLYAVVAAAAQRCIGGSGHPVVAGRNHMWPQEDPAGFMQVVFEFLEAR
jgi:pimeloyl-ACP methyl ester carboxylesterase